MAVLELTIESNIVAPGVDVCFRSFFSISKVPASDNGLNRLAFMQINQPRKQFDES